MKKLLQSVEKKIKQFITAHDESIGKYINDCAGRNGKRVRAKLLLLSHAVSKNNTAQSTEVAAVIEMVHLASLLHDDVVDNSEIRRGKKTLHSLWGNRVSIMLADYLLSKSIRLLCKKEKVELLDILTKTMETMALGQIKEMANRNNSGIIVSDYMEIIKQKTASLFSASCKIGAFMASSPARVASALEEFGKNTGIVFQITDDVLDFWGNPEATGKPVFNDLRDKNFTLPVILLREQANPADKNKLFSVLKSGTISREQAEDVLSLLNKYKIKEKVFNAAMKYFKKALDALDGIKNSPAKEGLMEILAAALERKK